MLGPYQNGDTGTKIFHTHHTMMLPPKYVSLFIDNSLGPREVWARLKAVTDGNGDTQHCEVLLQWL
jgi:hypothetical protein